MPESKPGFRRFVQGNGILFLIPRELTDEQRERWEAMLRKPVAEFNVYEMIQAASFMNHTVTVRRIREHYGLTQEEMAQAIDKSMEMFGAL